MADETPGKIPPYLGSGWHYLGPEGEADIKRQKEKLAEPDRLLSEDIQATFMTPQGQRVWEWLWKSTILSPTFMGHLGMEKAVPLGFAREGQNALVMELKRRMEQANG